MKRICLSLLVGVSFAWSYQVGDKIDEEIMKKLQLQKEKTYVIDFFASWCASCKKELPLIEKLSQKGVTVVGVDVDEDVAKGKAFQKELGLGFSVVDDPKGEIISRFDPVGMPAVYIVKKGKVVDLVLGAKDNIDELLLAKLQKAE